MKHLFKLWICVCCCVACRYETQGDMYDLDFEQVVSPFSPWTLSSTPIQGKGRAIFYVDTVVYSGRKHLAVSFKSEAALTYMGIPVYHPFYASLGQQLYVSDPSARIEIALSSRSVRIAKAWLKVSGCDIREQRLRTDSIPLPSTGEWEESRLIFRSDSAHFFRIEICAAQEPGVEPNTLLQEACFQVGQVRILVDGKKLGHEEPVAPLPSFYHYSGTFPDQLPESVRRKKILSLGEMVPGDSLSGDAALELTRHLVIQGHVRLLLTELPYDLALSLNLFIHNLTEWEEIIPVLEQIQTAPGVVKELLSFLRSHNRENRAKVYLAGISPSWVKPECISYFLKHAYEESDSTVLRTAAERLIQDSTRAVELLKKFGDTISDDPVHACIFSEVLRQTNGQASYWARIGMPPNLNAVMAENASRLIDSLSGLLGQTLLLGHWEHLNKVHTISPLMGNSCGFYLDRQYGADYYVIGILRGRGTDRKFYLPLPESPLFLENHCSNYLPAHAFYAFSEKDRFVCWLRGADVVGNRFVAKPVAVAERMDAFLWIE